MKGAFVKHLGSIDGELREALKGSISSSKREYVQHEGRISGGYTEYQMGIYVASVRNKWRIKVIQRITGVSGGGYAKCFARI